VLRLPVVNAAASTKLVPPKNCTFILEMGRVKKKGEWREQKHQKKRGLSCVKELKSKAGRIADIANNDQKLRVSRQKKSGEKRGTGRLMPRQSVEYSHLNQSLPEVL